MSFPNSPGVYDRIIDRSFNVNASGLVAGAVVITSDQGTLEPFTVSSSKAFVDTYGIPTSNHPSKWAAVRYLQRGGLLTVRRAITDAVAATGETTNTTAAALTFTAENPGSWGNNLVITFNDISTKEGAGVFEVIVSLSGAVVETFKVSRTEGAKDGFGANIYIEDAINGKSSYITVVDDPSGDAFTLGTETVTLTGGANDTAGVDSGDIITAWDDFLDVESVPASFLINAGFAIPAIQQKMDLVAQTRRDCIAILDVPEADADNVANMITYREDTLGLDSYYSALYGGWVRIYDQYNDRETFIPPSGDVAASYALTFEVAERWDAPAGLRRGVVPNALGMSKNFNDGERDQLYTAGINFITKEGGANAVIMGQKTLQVQSSALDRVNVVNNVIWLTGSMRESLRPFVMEANTEFTRNSVDFLLTSFLENIKQRGGLYDYNVDVSTVINTPQVIDNNQMLVDVFLQPVRAAEYVRLNVIITPTGVTLS